ncbi:MAG: hypothetical protein AAF483_18470 [Planctomycetota bacterium]
MSKIAAVILCLLTLLSSGCSFALIETPIGETLSIKEKRAFEGNWLTNDGELLRITIGSNGELVAGGIEFNEDKNKFTAKTHKFVTRKVGDVSYFYFRMKKHGYLFFRVESEDEDTLELFTADIEKFGQSVESGELDGKILKRGKDKDKSDVILSVADPSSTDSKLYQILAAKDRNDWFEEESVTYHRFKRN